jgi:hypothetical protein
LPRPMSSARMHPKTAAAAAAAAAAVFRLNKTADAAQVLCCSGLQPKTEKPAALVCHPMPCTARDC